MSSRVDQNSGNSFSVNQREMSPLNPTRLKVVGFVTGFLLTGLAISFYFLNVNAIAAYATGALGGALIAGMAIWTVVDCMRERKGLEDADQEDIKCASQSEVEETEIQKQLSDEEIIKDLQKQGYGPPIEEGGDGRCLFSSILPQITDADVQKGLSSKYAKYFVGWKALPINDVQDDKLDRLRQMALAEEEDFLFSISEPAKNEKIRIFELYKDMLQELEKLTLEEIRKRLTTLGSDPEVSIRTQFLYCKSNFKSYKSITQQKYNWAGTSELIAIGSILAREVKAFGRDLDPVALNKEGHVLPYFSSSSSTKDSLPIVVFQCNGGGHYRRLVPPRAEL